VTDITVKLYEWYSYMSETDEKRIIVGGAMDEINRLRRKLEPQGVPMTDIVDILRKTANQEFGTYNVGDDSVRVGCGTLRDAASEIERLRAKIEAISQVAGKASVDGVTFAQIKKEIRDGKSGE